MDRIGIRELKERTSEVLRRVREQGEIIEVTYRGRVIARLVPASEPLVTEQERAAAWARIDQVALEISARWPAGVSAVDAVRDVRRDL